MVTGALTRGMGSPRSRAAGGAWPRRGCAGWAGWGGSRWRRATRRPGREASGAPRSPAVVTDRFDRVEVEQALEGRGLEGIAQRPRTRPRLRGPPEFGPGWCRVCRPRTRVPIGLGGGDLCALIPSMRRPRSLGAITSTTTGARSISPSSAAALRCETTVPGPQASTAAIIRPRSPIRGRPTAKTPRNTGCRRPARIALAIELSPIPNRRNCPRDTTPCCRSASAAMRPLVSGVSFGRLCGP